MSCTVAGVLKEGETDRQTDRDRERGREKDRDRERQRQKERPTETETQREGETDRKRDRDRQTHKQRQRDRDTQRGKEEEEKVSIYSVGVVFPEQTTVECTGPSFAGYPNCVVWSPKLFLLDLAMGVDVLSVYCGW